MTGYYHDELDLCCVSTIPAYNRIWIPCLAFDGILAVLSLWAAIRHLRHYSKSPSLDRPHLVDVLIQGNVIYFLGCVFSCPYRIALDDRM